MLLALGSCNKLEIKPTDIIDPERGFRNLNDVNMGLIGVYALVDNSLMTINSTVSDEATFPVENTVGNSDAFRWLYNASSGSVTSLYYTYYRAIDRSNRALAGLSALTVNPAETATANRYRGELLALRAFLHFELLRAYASAYQPGAMGVPYMLESKIDYPERNSFESVVTLAKADLAAAKLLLPATQTDKTRMSRLAVTAIQARLALYEKNWNDAITYASEAIAALPLATKAQFPGLWTDANDSEVIWKMKRVGTTDSRAGDFYYRQIGDIVLYAPAFKLINTFDAASDLRYPAYILFDAGRAGVKSKYLVKKYIGGTASAPGLTDIKMFRTGEMYLIRAEARAEAGGDAAGDLNTLRAARINNYVNASFPDKNSLIEAIYLERYKELAFEGHRFFDLRRRNLPVERLAADAANASGAVLLQTTQAQYALPIPLQETQINKNTKQNPNY
ncbi:RagB/SusD family nutrient uptake outer membrane protein [Pedobacter yulinensis]|uniref:RagB/SusD family nutrient uptake outer membrane protein n=1 Tax=Pedobacter yulinensis TaxID=2126353 RepID=A0A2T3HGY7_9SPHI|nr:RagB/SusD family nutrient uptake outer membrane protein [Pedobacter yulinensis]